MDKPETVYIIEHLESPGSDPKNRFNWKPLEYLRTLKTARTHLNKRAADLTLYRIRRVITSETILSNTPTPAYRPPERPPFDPNCLFSHTIAKPGMRVRINTNSHEWPAGPEGTVLENDGSPSNNGRVLVCFDPIEYFKDKEELNRTIYMLPTSLTELKGDPS